MKADSRYHSFDLNEVFQQRLKFETQRKRILQQKTQQNSNGSVFPVWLEQINRFRNSNRGSLKSSFVVKTKPCSRSNSRLASSHQISRLTPENQEQFPMTARSSMRSRRLNASQQYEKERIQVGMRSLISSINNRKMSQEYKRSNQVRRRIMRLQAKPLVNKISIRLTRNVHNQKSASIKSVDSKKQKNSIFFQNHSRALQDSKNRQKFAQTARTSLAQKRKQLRKKLGQQYTTGQEFKIEQVYIGQVTNRQEGQNIMFPTQLESRRKPKTANIIS